MPLAALLMNYYMYPISNYGATQIVQIIFAELTAVSVCSGCWYFGYRLAAQKYERGVQSRRYSKRFIVSIVIFLMLISSYLGWDVLSTLREMFSNTLVTSGAFTPLPRAAILAPSFTTG
jgi:hypothetical protein